MCRDVPAGDAPACAHPPRRERLDPKTSSQKRLRRPIVEAPSLEAHTWLNVREPPRWRDLAGHIVVLDFFSSGDVGCLHALAESMRLAGRFADEPVVLIGVHTPRFDGERGVGHVRTALERLGVHWPVAVDPERAVWDRYSIKAWPARVVVDPDGYIIGSVAGEGHEELVERAIEQALVSHRRAANLATPAERWMPPVPRPAASTSALRFPSGLLARSDGTLFIADTQHRRVLRTRRVAAHHYAVEQVFEGFVEPRGLAASPTTLFVADRAQHSVLGVDLSSGAVRTVAGTGQLGTSFALGGPATRTALRSPWGLAWTGAALVVAVAGSHQLWVVKGEGDAADARPWAGSGVGRLVDATGAAAAFSQPRGLSSAGRTLVVADAASCAVRHVDLLEPHVETLVGRGLHAAGDQDGARDVARLQCPSDVALGEGVVFVADTLNHRVRVVARAASTYRDVGHVSTLCGAHGELDEPSALAFCDRGHAARLLVADTNHHRVVAVDPTTGEVVPVVLDGV